ncbi:MAG: hypothetical protein EP335_08105 [Alphaproteobacteria bacterium]|nr:MAG: hypothetical protein EP335_08105 [Alphaproteobacteria bacterium]
MISFDHIVSFFRGDEKGAEDKNALRNEALLMTLARGTSSDANIAALEVETVCRIYKEVTGEDVSGKDVRVAAISDLFKEASLERYLSKAAGKLSADDRKVIVKALASVIYADGKVNPLEADFFNEVAATMGLKEEAAGLVKG